jgi:hypothetical protein
MTGGGGSRNRYGGSGGGGGAPQDRKKPVYEKPDQMKLDSIIRGDLSPKIKQARKKSEENVLSKFVTKVGKSMLIGTLIGALSAVPVIGPLVIPLYTAYKLGMSGKKVIDAYREAKSNKEQAALTAGEKEVVKYVAGEITGAAIGHSAELIGEGVKTMAQKSGAVDEAAKCTGVNGDILAEMLQGSIENGIKEGFEAFAEFVVEGGE